MHVMSWGGLKGKRASMLRPAFSSDIRASLSSRGRPLGEKCLAIGNLRSYGDEVLSVDGHYIRTNLCDRVLYLDEATDTIAVESGITIDAIQRRIAPSRYIMPVTPGTAFLTVGGAIANDVHGKNHHRVGTFGRFVESFELVRTDGEIITCSRHENADWFAATIGGMGLTGTISWAVLKLQRVASPMLLVSSGSFENLSEFFEIEPRTMKMHEYSVAWIDCLAKGKSMGRGILSVADHDAVDEVSVLAYPSATRTIAIPFSPRISPVNRFSLGIFNAAYRRFHSEGARRLHFKNWLYPLDGIASWNRLYGRRGFYQFQCVVPVSNAESAVSEMLRMISNRGQGSFLAVLKSFGEQQSPGLMSFPMHGTTLALDFPNLGTKTRDLLLALHAIAASAGGRIYAAKDACSPGDSLRRGYPAFQRFKTFIDPGIGSMLAKRLGLLR